MLDRSSNRCCGIRSSSAGTTAPPGMTEIGFQLDENDNFHVAGNVRAEGAKFTLESPLLKRLPRGHRQFISVLSNQGNQSARRCSAQKIMHWR